MLVGVAELHGVVTSVRALVAQNADDLGVAFAALCPGDRVCVDADGLAKREKVLLVLATDKTTEKVKSGEKLVDRGFLVEALFPHCLTVHVGFDVSVEVLFKAVVDDRNAVGGQEICCKIACAGEIVGCVPETGNIVVLFKLAGVAPTGYTRDTNLDEVS